MSAGLRSPLLAPVFAFLCGGAAAAQHNGIDHHAAHGPTADVQMHRALVLFLFSLGMGIPLVIAAIAMARALPLLLRLEHAVPWMGLASAILMAGFGTLLISGDYMVVSEWAYRVASGRATAPVLDNTIVVAGTLVASLGIGASLLWRSRGLRLGHQAPSASISH